MSPSTSSTSLPHFYLEDADLSASVELPCACNTLGSHSAHPVITERNYFEPRILQLLLTSEIQNADIGVIQYLLQKFCICVAKKWNSNIVLQRNFFSA